MKQTLSYILFILSFSQLFADISPNPIVINGIYTVDDCKIQMTSEYVFANLYNDSAKVECTFNLENFGDATEIQIGFPEMIFQYWSISEYTPTDKANFTIYVDGQMLTEADIQVPSEMESIYQKYMAVYHYDNEYKRKRDSIYTVYGITEKGNRVMYPSGAEGALKALSEWRDSKPRFGSKLWTELEEQKRKGNFPWYVWNVNFKQQEKRQVKVVYSLPSGSGKGSDYRYFKYILETGSGWYKTIQKAEIELQLHDIEIQNIEEISPNIFSVDTAAKVIRWTFTDLEPTAQDDIYLRYFNPDERREWKKYMKKRERAYKYRFLRPRNWFK